MGFPPTLPIPTDVLRIVETLENAGHQTWCVGGALRDNLLGHDNNDFDLATAATPHQVQKLFRRTIPIGIDHGTVAVLDRNKTPHEVTTFRRDVKTDGRHAVVEFGVSLEDDLARRDFTINAIAYHPISSEWKDPFDGQSDLKLGLIRAVGDPTQRFREDYLRIIRGLRFAARFGFEIDPPTWEAAKAEAAGLIHLSAERVRQEWFRGLEGAQAPSRFVELWNEVGALEKWLPEVVTSHLPLPTSHLADPVLITAYLSSDPAATLTRLKCSRADIERGRRIGEFRGQEPDPGDMVAVRRWMATVGEGVDDLLAIAVAQGSGGELEAAVRAVRESNAPLSVGDLAIGGEDLLELGVAQGPAVGRLLEVLLGDVLVDPALNTKRELIERARREGSSMTADGQKTLDLPD